MRKFVTGLGMVVGLLAVLVLTLAAFRLPLGPSIELLVDGAFGDKVAWARTLTKATPLLLCGLGMVVAWRAGMYNIGGEGQFLIGGVCGAWVASALAGLSGGALNPLMLVASALGGAAYALIAGWLHVARGVQVVISTILLNFIAVQVLSWAVRGPLQESARQLPQTERLPQEAMLLQVARGTDLHSGVFVAALVALLVYAFLFLTVPGFRLRLVGENPGAARANRIDAGRTQLLAMAISGALCGLAAGIEFTGLAGELGDGFSQNWGFLAIPVALLGGLHPLGVVLSGTYFGALFAGSENLQRFGAPGSSLIYVIQAVAVLGFVGLSAWAKRREHTRPEVDA